jgi:hypothetical protein
MPRPLADPSTWADGPVFVGLQIDQSAKRQLIALAQHNDRSLSAEIRRAIDFYLDASP